MIRIPIEKAKDTMILGKTIYKDNGTILINSGTKLKDRYIYNIKKHGITHIHIKNEESDYEEIDGIIKENTKKEAVILTKKLMSKLKLSDDIDIDKLKRVINKIIDELLSEGDILISLLKIKDIDDYTFTHSFNVCILSLVTGFCLGYNREELLSLGLGAILHDIGKMRVPSNILNKPDRLTEEEFEEIKNHTVYGYDILKDRKDISNNVASIVLYHHERVDGKGYPEGIKKEDINDFVKIVSIADVYDALTSDRVYRKKLKGQQAIEYLIAMSGTHFDYNITNEFIKHIVVYSLGQGVELSNGEKGFVVKVNKSLPTRPTIKVVYNSNNKKLIKPYSIDLINNNRITIVDTFDNEKNVI